MSYKGKFTPKNPEKYKGDPKNIIYRSLWELKVMKYLDNNPAILEYASEEFFIYYLSPVDGKIHRYFPDFWVKLKNYKGEIKVQVWEVKPLGQTRPPKPPKKPSHRFLKEVVRYSVNEAKWVAAEKFCLERGWTFAKLTERELGITT